MKCFKTNTKQFENEREKQTLNFSTQKIHHTFDPQFWYTCRLSLISRKSTSVYKLQVTDSFPIVSYWLQT
jgi:hypothetical protein